MPVRPPLNRPNAKRERDARHDAHRGSARQRGYDSRWERARLVYLAKHPLCCMCQAESRIEAAKVVDHITPHKGDQTLFWDQANWQAICKPHHDRHKQREERGRAVQTIGVDGWPIESGNG